jgi:DNA-binding NarL/FixJ family response regulator
MKILLIDDHALVREALPAVLTKLKPEACVFEASNAAGAMRVTKEISDLDLVMLDLNLPDRDGFSVLTELRASHATTAVVVLSASNARGDINRALKLGALGFIPKTTEHEVLVNALQLVFCGGVYIPPEILDDEAPSAQRLSPSRSPLPPRRELPAELGLTDRQVEVLALMMQGKSNKMIAHLLDMAEPTVKNHVTAILKTLKVTNRTEAVIKVGNTGWESFPTKGS